MFIVEKDLLSKIEEYIIGFVPNQKYSIIHCCGCGGACDGCNPCTGRA